MPPLIIPGGSTAGQWTNLTWHMILHSALQYNDLTFCRNPLAIRSTNFYFINQRDFAVVILTL